MARWSLVRGALYKGTIVSQPSTFLICHLVHLFHDTYLLTILLNLVSQVSLCVYSPLEVAQVETAQSRMLRCASELGFHG